MQTTGARCIVVSLFEVRCHMDFCEVICNGSKMAVERLNFVRWKLQPVFLFSPFHH